MKNKLLQKIKVTFKNPERLKRQLIEKTQHYGLTGLGYALRALIWALYGKKSWRNFDSTSTIKWHIPSYKYYISEDKIAGIDAALKENLRSGEAVDKLAREFGIPEDEIIATISMNGSGVTYVNMDSTKN